MRKYAILLPTGRRSYMAVAVDKEAFEQLKKYREIIRKKIK